MSYKTLTQTDKDLPQQFGDSGNNHQASKFNRGFAK